MNTDTTTQGIEGEPGEDAGDARLVERSLKGDTAAWDDLYERHAGPLYNFLAQRLGPGRSNPVDDLFQETMLRAVAHLDRFDPRRGTFGAWLGGIGMNEIRQRGRKLRREAGLLRGLAVEGDAVEDGSTPAAAAASEDRRRTVNLAFTNLSPRHQNALEWKYWHSRSTSEMAALLGIDPPAVASLLYRARASFKASYRHLCSVETP